MKHVDACAAGYKICGIEAATWRPGLRASREVYVTVCGSIERRKGRGKKGERKKGKGEGNRKEEGRGIKFYCDTRC